MNKFTVLGFTHVMIGTLPPGAVAHVRLLPPSLPEPPEHSPFIEKRRTPRPWAERRSKKHRRKRK